MIPTQHLFTRNYNYFLAIAAHLDAVSLPGLPPEAEDGDAGDEAGDEAAQEAALAEVVGALVLLARKAEGAAAAWIRRGNIGFGFNRICLLSNRLTGAAVSAAAEDALLPVLRHVVGVGWGFCVGGKDIGLRMSSAYRK